MLRVITNRAWRTLQQRPLATVSKEPGVVGLTADSNSRETLAGLYMKTLDAIKQIPEAAAYRANVEKITNYRLDVVNGTEDVEKIEATLNVGQMPEIIEQAQDELELIPYMAEWRPWKTDGSKPVTIEIVE